MGENEKDIGMKIAGWLGLSRPPFHTFGILPFLLGTVVAWRPGHLFSVPVFVLSVLGIALVMLSTYYTGEYLDRTAAGLSYRPFARRSTSHPGWMLKIGIAAFSLAAVIALILQFGLHTGPLTLLLGCIGALPGFCYATRSCRWVDKGFGEFLISFCYSWLPIAAGFYLQRGTIAPCIHWMALPIGLSIFNVILLNEYADLPAAAAVGKTHLLTRLGKTKGMALHVLFSILSWFWMYSSLNAGVPRKVLYLYLPVMALSAGISLMMAGRKYENHFLLEWLCGLNIAVYLGTTVAYLLF
jgi:1,4-dihydroxy-2-naphthoate octaprenyltransferase